MSVERMTTKNLTYFLLILICGCISSILGHDSDVYTIQYTTENFSEELPKKNNFVMFYAPWCGHCQRLAPTWEQLAEMLNEEDGNVRIAKVDCTTDRAICTNQDITGYPTLIFFKKGKQEGEKFRGTRDLPTLTTFINEQLRGGEEDDELKVSLTYGLVELTDDNFEKNIDEGKHFIKFYAPWCGHCQLLAPIWQELAKTYEFDSSVTIAKLDCTQHKSTCREYEIKAYPTLLWFDKGKKIDRFQGSRTHDDLVNYVKKMVEGKAEEKEEQAEVKEKEPSSSEQGVIEVTSDNFKDTIQSGITIIKFFAPWCGHCKSLAPTWEDLGKKYSNVKHIKIAKVDCTAQENKLLCNDEKVDGFPTIYLYRNSVKISEYTGGRSLEDLSDFIEGHTEHDEL